MARDPIPGWAAIREAIKESITRRQRANWAVRHMIERKLARLLLLSFLPGLCWNGWAAVVWQSAVNAVFLLGETGVYGACLLLLFVSAYRRAPTED